MEEQLISLVYERPALWDKRLRSHGNRNTVDKCWKEISETMKIAEPKLRKKWKYLRDQFSVEQAKMNARSWDPDGETSKWPHFKFLHFLKDIVKARPPAGILHKPSTTSAHKEVFPESSQVLSTFLVENTNSWENQDVLVRKKRKNHLVDKRLDSSLRQEQKQLEEDDDRYFLLSLLPMMKTIPLHLKIAARVDIMQSLSNYMSGPTLLPNQQQNQTHDVAPHQLQQQQQYPQIQQVQTHQQEHIISLYRVHQPCDQNTPKSHAITPSSPTSSVTSDVTNFKVEEVSEDSVF